MKTNILVLLLAAVGAIKVNVETDIATDSDKHSKTMNMALIRDELKKGRNVDPKDEISWEYYDRNASLIDEHYIWSQISRAKRQPANVSTIDWSAVPDDMLQKMIETGYMPHKGIPNKVHGYGPWLPKHFPELSHKYMPNGTDVHFLLQGSKEVDDNVQMISKELEKIGVHGGYDAFKMLRPGSYKADLWRQMNLWYYGGLYMDAKLGLDTHAHEWIDFDNDEWLYCPDRSGYVNCPMLAMTQYHPIGALAAKMTIERVENRTYFDDQWRLTGPGVWRDVSNGTGMTTAYNTRCWVKYQGNAKLDSYLITDKDDLTNMTQQTQEGAEKNFRIIKTNPYGEDIWAKMKTCKTCNTYVVLNEARQVYCDQPGTPCDGKDFMQWQDKNSVNHNKTGGHINFVDERKDNTAYFQNKTSWDSYWDQTLTSEQKKDFEKYDHAMQMVNGWWYTVTKMFTQKPDYSLWHKEF